MAAVERSLRRVVESWLGTQNTRHIRVTRFSDARGKRCRYARVEIDRDKGSLVMLFFRHDDGSWCVFPPPPHRPVLGAVDNHASRAVVHDAFV
ncbi:hypothetical protein KNO81_23350 [Paraburkholderia sediminicola]|nr:hypothetical protein [Paraburkholderia sediminicola]